MKFAPLGHLNRSLPKVTFLAGMMMGSAECPHIDEGQRQVQIEEGRNKIQQIDLSTPVEAGNPEQSEAEGDLNSPQITKPMLPCFGAGVIECNPSPTIVCINISDEVNPTLKNLKPEVSFTYEDPSFLNGVICRLSDPVDMKSRYETEWDYEKRGFFPADVLHYNQYPSFSENVYVCDMPGDRRDLLVGFEGEERERFTYDSSDPKAPKLVSYSQYLKEGEYLELCSGSQNL